MNIYFHQYHDRIIAKSNCAGIVTAQFDTVGHVTFYAWPWVPNILVDRVIDMIVAEYIPERIRWNGIYVQRHPWTEEDGFRNFFSYMGAVKE